jgi:hypothetical protein
MLMIKELVSALKPFISDLSHICVNSPQDNCRRCYLEDLIQRAHAHQVVPEELYKFFCTTCQGYKMHIFDAGNRTITCKTCNTVS